MKKSLSLLMLFLLGYNLCGYSQLSSTYTFSQSTETYTPITGGTLVDSAYYGATSELLDTKGWSITLPFSFGFNGGSYTSVYANSNGGISLGATTSTSSTLISGTSAYSGAIAPMNRDLWGAFVSQGSITTGSNMISSVTDFTGIEVGKTLRNTTGIATGTTISSFDLGAGTITMSAPATATSTTAAIGWGNGEVRTEQRIVGTDTIFVIQWENFSDYGTTANTASVLNFQVHLYKNSNIIIFVYGANSQIATTARTNQVGLRGATNTDYLNRTSATSWSSTIAGTTNNATVTRTNTINPYSGLTFSWAPPSCQTPSGLIASSIKVDSATISWTATTPAPTDGYSYYYSTSNTAPTPTAAPSGSVTAGTTSTSLSGLSPNTTYYFWVRAKCSSTDSSAWSSTGTFTTLCNSTTLPLTEDFNATTLPSCWTKQIVALQTASKITFVATGSSPTTTPFEGSHFLQYNSFSSTGGGSGSEERLIAPPINTTSVTSVDVNFQWRNENNTSYSSGAYLAEGVQVQFSTDGGVTWTNAGSLFTRHDATLTAGTSQWNQKIVTLPAAAAGVANLLVGFKFHSSYGDNMFMDYVQILETPPAPNCVTSPLSPSNGASVCNNTSGILPYHGMQYQLLLHTPYS